MSHRDASLDQAYRQTQYRVRLPAGGHAVIRIGRPLPPALRPFAPDGRWGFLTAWNPDSLPAPRPTNQRAQYRLLQTLSALPGCRWRPGIGVGTEGWREPSLWVLGLDPDRLQRLATDYGQRAWVGPDADGIACLYYCPTDLPPANRF
ncbi:DUF3293 domain-containing protein [Frateuria aurantia]